MLSTALIILVLPVLRLVVILTSTVILIVTLTPIILRLLTTLGLIVWMPGIIIALTHAQTLVDVRLVQIRILLNETAVNFVAQVARDCQIAHLRLDQLKELSFLWLVCHLDCLLDDIVAVLISKERAERLGLHNLENHFLTDVLAGTLKAFLDDI